MKTMLRLTMVMAVVLTAVGVRANKPDDALYVKKEKGKTIRFALNETKKTEISILDAADRILYSESASGKNGINRSYDLKELPQGTYFLEFDNAAKVTRYEITLSEKEAVLSKKPIVETFKPVLTSSNGMVTLKITNAKSPTITIRVYDSYHNEMYSETVKGASTLSKKFDVRNNAGAAYTFVVDYDNKSFTESIVSR